VLDVQGSERGIILVQLTVFASVASARPDKGFPCLGYHLRHRPEKLSCLSLQDGNEFIRADIALIFRTFRDRELSFRRFGGQFLDTIPQRWLRAEVQHGVCFVLQQDP